jgi:hypothetical protein
LPGLAFVVITSKKIPLFQYFQRMAKTGRIAAFGGEPPIVEVSPMLFSKPKTLMSMSRTCG